MTEDAKLRLKKGAHGWRRWVRTVTIALLVAVSGVALSGYVVIHWAERQILTSDNWVALVAPLPKQPVVSTALGGYISTQIFSSKTIEAEIADALPPRAAFLAGPLTDQLRGVTTKHSQKVVASDGFQTVWEGANRIAMTRLVAKARGESPPLAQRVHEKFNLNLSAVSGQLKTALGSASSAIPALQPSSQKAIGVTTELKASAERVRQVVRTIDKLAVVLPLIALTAYLCALALTRQRRKTTLYVVSVVFVLMFVELIMVKWFRQQLLVQVKNGANLGAVSYIFDTLVGWLRHMVYVVIALSVVVMAALWLGGPATRAAALRNHLKLDRLHRSVEIAYGRRARLWVGQYEYYLWLASGVTMLIGLALVGTVSGLTIINGLLALLGTIALIHIIATPPYADPAMAGLQ